MLDNRTNVTNGGRKPSVSAGNYECPRCGTRIEVHVRMSCLPLCTMHNGAVPMEFIKRVKETVKEIIEETNNQEQEVTE